MLKVQVNSVSEKKCSTRRPEILDEFGSEFPIFSTYSVMSKLAFGTIDTEIVVNDFPIQLLLRRSFN